MRSATKSVILRTIFLSTIFNFLDLTTNTSWAILGEQVNTVETDRQRMNGMKQIWAHPQYEIHEILFQGQVLREYVSFIHPGINTVNTGADTGTVFAITWTGITHPDLSILLGNYFPEVSDALAAPVRHTGPRAHTIQSSRVIIEKGGHMRAVTGRAYVPALFPAGISLEDIL